MGSLLGHFLELKGSALDRLIWIPRNSATKIEDLLILVSSSLSYSLIVIRNGSFLVLRGLKLIITQNSQILQPTENASALACYPSTFRLSAGRNYIISSLCLS